MLLGLKLSRNWLIDICLSLNDMIMCHRIFIIERQISLVVIIITGEFRRVLIKLLGSYWPVCDFHSVEMLGKNAYFFTLFTLIYKSAFLFLFSSKFIK